MRCAYYEAGRCRSCSELPIPYPEQLRAKELHCRSALAAFESAHVEWLPSVPSRELRFRNKAKMVVSGTVEKPLLGILDASQAGIDLTGCPLYPEELAASFSPIAEFISNARMIPYDVRRRTGELKYVLVTWARHSGRLMVRFVLRTDESVLRIRKHLPELLEALPQVDVVSVNLQPEHNAIVEGETEILLTERGMLEMELNGRTFFLPPGAFFQTNTEVAEELYRQAESWVETLQPSLILDLFCGIGAFAVHCTAGDRRVFGIESSRDAVEGARRSADLIAQKSPSFQRAELAQLHEPSGSFESVIPEFSCRDATDIDVSGLIAEAGESSSPNVLAIVNPPRRGIGESLARSLDASPAQWVIYSSCQVETLVRDLRSMPHFVVRNARLLDMFPHTHHYEVIVLLERAAIVNK